MPGRPPPPSVLYRRWIAANAIGELVGLGGTFLVAAAALPTLAVIEGRAGVLAGFVVLVAAGAFEATVLAWLQHGVLRTAFPSLRLLAWWRATTVGALIAYALGYLPSTLFGAAEAGGAEPPPEPAAWLTLLLAAALGLVAGAILSAFQAAVLRPHVRRSGHWIVANMAAWALGMPLVFLGMDLAFRSSSLGLRIGTIAAALVVAGALVGAVHGRTLVRFSAEVASSRD